MIYTSFKKIQNIITIMIENQYIILLKLILENKAPIF